MLTKIKKFFFKNILLISIVVFASILRFYNLSNNPPSLNWDEVSHGYNAYSILKTGRDEWGNFFPIIFRAYGDYKLPVYIYLAAISEFFFGLTPFAVRFVSAFAGVGTVFFTYFSCLELFAKRIHGSLSTIHRPLATLAALMVAIEPWSLFLSRAALEANLALFFFISGIYFFFRFLRFSTTHNSLLTSISLGLTVWTYNSYRIFTPLMFIVLTYLFRKEIAAAFRVNKKLFIYCLVPIALFFVPMFFQLLSSVGQARYSFVQILDQGTIARIEQVRNGGGSRLIHNKATYFASEFSKNYISHFSPKFLFFGGGDNYQFSVPGRGVMYPVNIIFFYLGLVVVFWKVLTLNNDNKRTRHWHLILFWLILAPIPSSLTREAPHVLRAITFLPMPMILTSIGFIWLINRSKLQNLRLNTTILYSIVVLGFIGNYLIGYFGSYRRDYSSSWQHGYNQVAKYIEGSYSKYDKIVITKEYGEPHEFLLFYLKYNPSSYLSDPNLNRFYQSSWYWVDGFDKFYFVNDWEISQNRDSDIPRSIPEKDVFKLESGGLVDCYSSNSKCLLVTSPGNYPSSWTKLETINFLNGKPAFEIYEN